VELGLALNAVAAFGAMRYRPNVNFANVVALPVRS